MNCELFLWLVVLVSFQIFCLSRAALSLFCTCVVQQSVRDWTRKNLGISSLTLFLLKSPPFLQQPWFPGFNFLVPSAKETFVFHQVVLCLRLKALILVNLKNLFYTILSTERVPTPIRVVCFFLTTVFSGNCFF